MHLCTLFVFIEYQRLINYNLSLNYDPKTIHINEPMISEISEVQITLVPFLEIEIGVPSNISIHLFDFG